MSSLYQKNGIWTLGIMLDTPKGRIQKVRSLGTRNQREAIRRAKQIEEELTSVSLSKLLDIWVVRKIQNFNSKRYIQEGKNCMSEFIGYFGDVSASGVTTQKLRDYKFFLTTVKKNNPTTIGIKLRTLKAIFSFGYKEGLVPNKPFLGLEIPRAKNRIEFLSKDEISKLIEISSVNPLHQSFIEFFLQSGCRSGEFRNLKWDDINDSVLEFNGKTGRRVFPLNENIKETLSKIKENQKPPVEYVCSNKDGRYMGSRSWIGKIIKEYLREVKLIYTAHTLRHTFVSHLVMNGTPLHIVQQLAGHKSITTTMLYAHLRPEILMINTKYY